MTSLRELDIPAVNEWLEEQEELKRINELSENTGDTVEYDINEILNLEVSDEL